MLSFETILNSVLALLAVLNPVGLLPVYEELAEGLEVQQKRKLYHLTTLAGFLTLLTLSFTGRWIMDSVFHISIDEFRIAGGILLTVLGVQKVLFQSHHHETLPENVMELGVVPMAVPLLVGPGSIVTGILILDREGWLSALLSIVMSFALVFAILSSSRLLYKFLGRLGTLVIGRILYIFIAAIGVNFLLGGLSSRFGLG